MESSIITIIIGDQLRSPLRKREVTEEYDKLIAVSSFFGMESLSHALEVH